VKNSFNNAMACCGFLLLAATVLLAAMSDAANAPGAVSGAQYIWAAALMAVVGALGLRWLASTDTYPHPWLHAPVIITAYVVFLVVLPGFMFFVIPATMDPSGIVQLRYLTSGVVLMLVGIASLWVGYLAGLKWFSPLRFVESLQKHPLSLTAVLGLYSLTVLARLVRILVVGIAYNADTSLWGAASAFDQWISYLEGTRYLVLGIVAVRVLSGLWPRNVLIGVLALEVVFGFTSGFMKPLLWIVIVVGVSAVIAGVQLSRYTRFLVPLGLASILIVPVSQAIRYSTLHQGLETRSPAAMIASTWAILQNIWTTGSDVGLTEFLEYVPARLGSVAYMPGLAMSRTPEMIPFLGFDRLLEIPLYLLPRALWAEKPSLSRSQWFSVQYLDMDYDTQSSTAVTMFGETYLFAGWITVIIGLLLLGLLLAFIFRNTASAGLVAIYIALIPGFTDIESEFTTKIVSLIQGPILLFLAYGAVIAASRFLGVQMGSVETGSNTSVATAAGSSQAPAWPDAAARPPGTP
jgi:hypothetical protein